MLSVTEATTDIIVNLFNNLPQNVSYISFRPRSVPIVRKWTLGAAISVNVIEANFEEIFSGIGKIL